MRFQAAQLRGIIPPIVSPLNADGSLDRPGLKRLVDHIIEGGVHAIFALGTTGEGVCLSYKKRQELVETAAEAIDGRVPLLVGVTDTCLEEATDFASFSADSGASAVVVAPPYYLPIDQIQLRHFYRQLADASELPVILYNMPSCVKMSLEAPTVLELIQHPNIIGMKDSGGDIAYFRNLIGLLDGKNFPLIVGPENLLWSALRSGGMGGVHGGANMWPRLYTRLYEAHCAGNRDLAAACDAMIQRVCQQCISREVADR